MLKISKKSNIIYYKYIINMKELKAKILIADDDKAYLLVWKQGFLKGGFDVTTVENGHEALIAAKKEKFDLIIFDIAMPEIGGVAAAKKLKDLEINVPIIFLTNLKDAEHIGEAVEAVVNTDYIIKSDISVESLVERVKNKLNIK